ncbi:hypothetical protein [Nonomuraea sp. WAC 01424]|uniref:hypothetical protein n=1 Tax=Nonomuraea sp. WAC 01424 TaxID=2203200 RepID=UPI000F7AA3FF|nr:hypothetical protein [Nonomuraea sp. WAC 01424]
MAREIATRLNLGAQDEEQLFQAYATWWRELQTALDSGGGSYSRGAFVRDFVSFMSGQQHSNACFLPAADSTRRPFDFAANPTMTGERDIPHTRPVRVTPLGEPQIHDYTESQEHSPP